MIRARINVSGVLKRTTGRGGTRAQEFMLHPLINARVGGSYIFG